MSRFIESSGELERREKQIKEEDENDFLLLLSKLQFYL
jgi:hypothetical protein